MVHLTPFHVEAWMDAHETRATYNLAETCAASISLEQLHALSTVARPGSSAAAAIFAGDEKMTYGEIRGLASLRENIAELYREDGAPALESDNVLVTPGAIMANHLVMYALVAPGDHVIVHYPTYQQLYETPRALGATVELWRTHPDSAWEVDVEALERMVTRDTRMIVINNPQNPTGAVTPRAALERIVAIARRYNILIVSDEVYRPLFHNLPADESAPPSILALGYEHAIATGSLSKAFSLAGIRVGWVATRSAQLLEKVAEARHYTTISVSMLDSAVASYATSAAVVHALLERNRALAATNRAVLERWVRSHADNVSWVVPRGGTTAFVRFERGGRAVDAMALCTRLVEEEGVLFVPGDHAFGEEGEWKGYVRIGYVCETEVLVEGLKKVDGWMEREFGTLEVEGTADGV